MKWIMRILLAGAATWWFLPKTKRVVAPGIEEDDEDEVSVEEMTEETVDVAED